MIYIKLCDWINLEKFEKFPPVINTDIIHNIASLQPSSIYWTRWDVVVFEDIPPEVIAQAKLHILDILGIGLAASDLAWRNLPTWDVESTGSTCRLPNAK